MKKGSYPLASIYRDVAYFVKASGDDSATTIRTHINDHLDMWSKGGFKVNHNYNQERAIKIVRRLVKEI